MLVVVTCAPVTLTISLLRIQVLGLTATCYRMTHVLMSAILSPRLQGRHVPALHPLGNGTIVIIESDQSRDSRPTERALPSHATFASVGILRSNSSHL